jgi:transposase
LFQQGGEDMAAPLVSDELWNEIEPLIPKKPIRSDRRGRPPVDTRMALVGIVFVLRAGIAWNMLPAEMGCGSGVTCWRRLRDWTKAGVWAAIHAKMLHLLGKAGQLDAERAVADSASVRAVFGGRTRDRIRQTAEKRAANAMC